MKKQSGFTLIELLIVVAIIGLIAAIAIPNLLNAMQRSKQKRTMADIRQIAMAWEARSVETGGYTSAGADLCCTEPITIDEAREFLEPSYINPFPRHDGWGNEFVLGVNSIGSSYAITSHGKDGLEDESFEPGATSDFDCDIIYSNGSFVTYPEGTQSQ